MIWSLFGKKGVIGWAGTTKDSIQIKFSKECPDFNGPFALLFKNDFVQKAEPGDIKELKAFFRTKKAPMHDPVLHPSHYSWRGGMEAADIAAEMCQGAEGDEAAWIFNLAKYVYRYPKKNGVQTSEAFTGFQGILSAVSKQSQQTVKTAAAMGIDFTPEHLGQVGWIKFLEEVKAKVGDDQTAIQHLFGRVEAANAFKVLTKDLGQLKDAQRAMGDSMGATELAFNKMLTPAEKNKIAMNQMKNALMDLRGVVAPVVMATAQAVKAFTSWWNGLSDGQKAFAVHAIQVVAAFGAITLGVGKSISAVGRFSIFINRLPRTFRNIRSAASIIGKGFHFIPGALRLVGGGFLRLAGIVRMAMSGIAAAVAANPVFFALTALVMLLVVVYNHWDEIVSYVKENFPQVYAVVTSVVSNVMNKLSTMIDWITGTLIPMWTNGWNTMKAIFEGAFDGISTIAHRALDWILGKVESIKSAVSGIHLPSFSLGGHATGTMGLPGGTTFIHEQGPEIMDLPTGTRIIPHSESLKQEYARGRKEGSGKGGMSITIPKLADQIVVRENADVDRIMEKLVFKLKQFSINRMEGAI